MNTEDTHELSDFDFNGIWISADGKRVFTLEQSEQRVAGVYAGQDTGSIEGTARGNQLDFTWSSSRPDRGNGWGY